MERILPVVEYEQKVESISKFVPSHILDHLLSIEWDIALHKYDNSWYQHRQEVKRWVINPHESTVFISFCGEITIKKTLGRKELQEIVLLFSRDANIVEIRTLRRTYGDS